MMTRYRPPTWQDVKHKWVFCTLVAILTVVAWLLNDKQPLIDDMGTYRANHPNATVRNPSYTGE